MTLRSALDDAKRTVGSPTRFPGERRSTAGLFSGLDDRVVYVDVDGSIRDYGYPLSGLDGIDRSRIGVARSGDVRWFDDLELADQRYYANTALVETTYDGDPRIERYDLTLGDAHLTRVECEGGLDDVMLHAFVSFAPDAREGRIGRLVHGDGDVVEAYHRRERDYLAASTGFGEVRGQTPERFEELLADDPVEFPRSVDDRYEADRLGGAVHVIAPLSRGGTMIVSLLTDREETSRERALARTRGLADDLDTVDALRRAAEDQAGRALPALGDLPRSGVEDLRVLELLSASTGARIAGPEFDPFYAHSGGYGYTWFRDDSEIARFLLDAESALGLDLSDRHARSARFYCGTQLSDGTWPHRVWPHDGSLAPGWANARLEGGEGVDYQADQTASAAAFLSCYLRARDPEPTLAADVREALGAALDGLDDALAADGLPAACQNVWEDMTGRFAHTAATYLGAYAEIARAPVDDGVRDRADDRAGEVHDAIDRLWSEERGCYALRAVDSDLDDRLDASTLALVKAHAGYAALADGLDDARLDRLVSHVETTLDGLWRDTGAVAGLIRYEGDDWRIRDQADEKIWTVSTAWAAFAAARLSTLLAEHDRPADAFAERARDLLDPLLPGGSLALRGGYLPEQVFDDGTPDSATPLGWPHAIRLAARAHLE